MKSPTPVPCRPVISPAALFARPVRPEASEYRIEAVRYFLRQLPPFRSLAEPHLRDIAASAVVKSFRRDAYLFHRDDPVSGLFFVRQGIINLHRVAFDGREVVIHFFREGELLAEIPDESGKGCSADARAVVDSEVVMIPWREFAGKCRCVPELALSMLSSVERQVDDLADAFEDHVSSDAVTRFVHWLLRRCANETRPVEIDLGITKRILATELGVRQETLSRALRNLSESGYLDVRGRHITVKNPQTLRSDWVERNTCAAAA